MFASHAPKPARISFCKALYSRAKHSPANADALLMSFASFDAPEHGCYHQTAGWSSLVARWAHNPKVGGSNPPPATNICNHLGPLSRAAFSILSVSCPCSPWGREPSLNAHERSKSPKKANRRRKLVITPVAVEKLFRTKIAKTKLRQDAL